MPRLAGFFRIPICCRLQRLHQHRRRNVLRIGSSFLPAPAQVTSNKDLKRLVKLETRRKHHGALHLAKAMENFECPTEMRWVSGRKLSGQSSGCWRARAELWCQRLGLASTHSRM